MTKSEINALNTIADYIDGLSSLENCGVSEKAKEEFRAYMQWFNSATYYLRKVVEVTGASDRWEKQHLYNEIERYLY